MGERWHNGNALARRSASAYANGRGDEARKMLVHSKSQLNRSASHGFDKARRRVAEVEQQGVVQSAAAPPQPTDG